MRDFISRVVSLVTIAVVLFVLVAMFSLPVLPFLSDKSNNLSCARIKINYAECRQYRAHLFGLFKERSLPMVVTGATLQTYKIESVESISTGYKIFINTKNVDLEFYDYITDENKAKQDIQHIHKFLTSEGKASSHLKASKSFWGELHLVYVSAFSTFFLCCIFGLVAKLFSHFILR
jgi:hypothetical protein